MKSLNSSININYSSFKERAILRPREQLFEPSGKDYYNALSQKKCPLCSGNLYLMAHGKMWYCKSKTKHPKFVIGVGKMNKYI